MDYQYAKYATEKALEVLAIDSPTGYTKDAAEWVKKEFEALGFNAQITTKGGVLVDLGGNTRLIERMILENFIAPAHHIQKEIGALTARKIGFDALGEEIVRRNSFIICFAVIDHHAVAITCSAVKTALGRANLLLNFGEKNAAVFR